MPRARETAVSPAASAALVDARRAVAARRQLRLVEVDDDQQRLRREKLKAAQPLQIFALEIERAQRPSVFERRAAERDDVALALELGRAALLQILLEPFEPALGDAEVREDQLVFHRLRVARRIDRPRRMRHRRIVEGAEDVDERVGVLVGGDVDQRLRAAGSPGAARSVNSTVAGTRFFGLNIAVSRSSRASGTFEMPIDASPLPARPAPVSLALVMS